MGLYVRELLLDQVRRRRRRRRWNTLEWSELDVVPQLQFASQTHPSVPSDLLFVSCAVLLRDDLPSHSGGDVARDQGCDPEPRL